MCILEALINSLQYIFYCLVTNLLTEYIYKQIVTRSAIHSVQNIESEDLL